MADTDYLDSSGRAAVLRQGIRQRELWLSVPTYAMAISPPLVILIYAAWEDVPGALLAYVNLLISLFCIIEVTKRRTLGALVPLLYLAILIIGTIFGSIYFAVIAPDSSYRTLHGTTRMLFRSERMQLMTMAFMGLYLIGFYIAGWGRVRVSQVDTQAVARGLRWWAVIVGFGMFALNGAAKLGIVSEALAYIADGAFLYLSGLFLIVGATWHCYSRATRVLVVLGLIAVVAFYLLGNARGMAIIPVGLLMFGAYFLGTLKERTKIIGLIIASFAFAMVLVIGNTTRNVMNTVGFSNLSERFEAMMRWREVAERQDVGFNVFGRLWHTAGHTIMTKMPDQYAYMPFSGETFFGELITRVFVPGSIYFSPVYSATGVLIPLGFYITKNTSVEVTTMGSLWMIGGWLPFVIGALAVGLAHGLLARWIDRAAAISPSRGLFYLAMMSSALVFQEGLTVIEVFRTLFTHAVAAVILYHLAIRPFVERQNAPAV